MDGQKCIYCLNRVLIIYFQGFPLLGELILYIHSWMVACYDAEGLYWGLPLVRSWDQYPSVLN